MPDALEINAQAEIINGEATAWRLRPPPPPIEEVMVAAMVNARLRASIALRTSLWP